MLVIKSMATINCLVTNILQSIFFCVQQKKETCVDLEQLWGWASDDSFYFWANYPFKEYF